MQSQSGHRQKRQDVFIQSIEWIANICAFIAAFLLSPEVYIRTVGWVIRIAETRYGAGEFIDLVCFVWFVTVAALMFFTARATLATAIVAAGVAAATKFI